MNRSWNGCIAALALAALSAASVGCTVDDEEVEDDEVEEVAAATDEAKGLPPTGELDPDNACDSLSAPGEPQEQIVWVTEPAGEIEIHDDVALDWAFQYAVRVSPSPQGVYSVEHARCGPPAMQGSSCERFSLPVPAEACAVAYAPRFGLDPSQYQPGLNEYSFTLILRRDGAAVARDRFNLVLRVHP